MLYGSSVPGPTEAFARERAHLRQLWYRLRWAVRDVERVGKLLKALRPGDLDGKRKATAELDKLRESLADLSKRLRRF